MRRIETTERKEKREKRLKVVVGSVIIFLLVVSTLGYALVFGGQTGGTTPQGDPTQTQTIEQNEDGAYFNGRYWVYAQGTTQRYFSYEHAEVETIPSDISLTSQDYAGQTVYLVGGAGARTEEIALNIQSLTGKMQQACYGPCEEDLPEKTCEDYLIVIEDSDTQIVTQEDNCVFIAGDLKAVDAFLYSLFGLPEA